MRLAGRTIATSPTRIFFNRHDHGASTSADQRLFGRDFIEALMALRVRSMARLRNTLESEKRNNNIAPSKRVSRQPTHPPPLTPSARSTSIIEVTQRFKSASDVRRRRRRSRQSQKAKGMISLQVFGDESAEHGDEGDGGEDRLNAAGGEPPSFFPLRLWSSPLRPPPLFRFDLHPEIFTCSII